MGTSFRNRAVLDLPCRLCDHDATKTRTLDRSGYDNHAIYTAGATAPTKLANKLGYSFSGSQLMIASGTGTQLLGNMTACALIQRSALSTNGYDAIIIQTAFGETLETNVLWSIQSATAPNQNRMKYTHEYGAGVNQEVEWAYQFALNKLYHVLITRNISTNAVDFYVDGAYQETYTYGTDPAGGTSTVLTIGRNIGYASPETFNGTIADVRVFPIALTPTQIIALYRDDWRRYHMEQS